MKTVKVVAAVIMDGDRVLSTRRGYGEYKGYWEFPGGKREEGETPEQALAREIREEMNVEISVGERIGTVEYDYPSFHLSMDCFWAEVISGEIELLEADGMAWLKKEGLDSVDWLPADRAILDRVKAGM